MNIPSIEKWQEQLFYPTYYNLQILQNTIGQELQKMPQENIHCLTENAMKEAHFNPTLENIYLATLIAREHSCSACDKSWELILNLVLQQKIFIAYEDEYSEKIILWKALWNILLDYVVFDGKYGIPAYELESHRIGNIFLKSLNSRLLPREFHEIFPYQILQALLLERLLITHTEEDIYFIHSWMKNENLLEELRYLLDINDTVFLRKYLLAIKNGLLDLYKLETNKKSKRIFRQIFDLIEKKEKYLERIS